MKETLSIYFSAAVFFCMAVGVIWAIVSAFMSKERVARTENIARELADDYVVRPIGWIVCGAMIIAFVWWFTSLPTIAIAMGVFGAYLFWIIEGNKQ